MLWGLAKMEKKKKKARQQKITTCLTTIPQVTGRNCDICQTKAISISMPKM